MSLYLEVMCNYDCGAVVLVEGERPSAGEVGRTLKSAVYEWLGRVTLDALKAHHKVCPEYAKAHPDEGRHLRVVKP